MPPDLGRQQAAEHAQHPGLPRPRRQSSRARDQRLHVTPGVHPRLHVAEGAGVVRCHVAGSRRRPRRRGRPVADAPAHDVDHAVVRHRGQEGADQRVARGPRLPPAAPQPADQLQRLVGGDVAHVLGAEAPEPPGPRADVRVESQAQQGPQLAEDRLSRRGVRLAAPRSGERAHPSPPPRRRLGGRPGALQLQLDSVHLSRLLGVPRRRRRQFPAYQDPGPYLQSATPLLETPPARRPWTGAPGGSPWVRPLVPVRMSPLRHARGTMPGCDGGPGCAITLPSARPAAGASSATRTTRRCRPVARLLR